MDGCSSAQLCAELQSVFEFAVGALQSEEAKDPTSALNSYYLAQSRIRYVLEAFLPQLCEREAANPDLAVIVEGCRQLEATYSWVIQRLSTGGACSEMLTADAHGSALCGGVFGGAAGHHPDAMFQDSQPLESRDAGEGLRECRRPGLDAADLPQDLRDAAKRCMREVQGSLEEVVGLAAIKQELREAVLLPMHVPQLFVGIRRPQCNIMFHGVPGTGKTMLVEKIAAEAGIPLLCISPSAILSKWSGDSEKTLRAVFEAATQMAPAVVFLDEIDSLAPARSSGDDLSSRRVLTELLIQMTNVTNKPGCLVYVMACTNRLVDCDAALLRRFDRRIEVPVPDAAARRAFFLSTVKRPEIASSLSEEEVAALAEGTEGCTGSDLSTICREAAMAPLRELMQAMQVALAQGRQVHAELFSQATVRPVTFDDFSTAIVKLGGGASA